MEERQEQLLESILEELQKFNARFNDELERAENERTIQAAEDSDHATKLAEDEKQAIALQDQQVQEKAKLEADRFEKVEEFFNKQIEKSESLEYQFSEMTEILESNEAVAIDQSNHQDIMIGIWMVILAIVITTVSKGTFDNLTKSWR